MNEEEIVYKLEIALDIGQYLIEEVSLECYLPQIIKIFTKFVRRKKDINYKILLNVLRSTWSEHIETERSTSKEPQYQRLTELLHINKKNNPFQDLTKLEAKQFFIDLHKNYTDSIDKN